METSLCAATAGRNNNGHVSEACYPYRSPLSEVKVYLVQLVIIKNYTSLAEELNFRIVKTKIINKTSQYRQITHAISQDTNGKGVAYDKY